MEMRGYVRKRTGFMTNLPELAEELNKKCVNGEQQTEVHRHVKLISGIAWKAQVHPPRLVGAVLRAVKKSMEGVGYLSAADEMLGGPVPVERGRS